MKYVYFAVTDVNPDWIKRAKEAAAVAAALPDARSQQEYITKNTAIWRDFKPILEALSHGKCWYTEAKDKVAYWEVDHYRPKKIYPWLAFCWQNFRLCGGKPNRRKTDEFPLEEEAHRATFTAPDVTGERPLLLDPIRWGDPDLLTFKADGEPTCANPADDCATRRVRETVVAMGLHDAILCEERRAKWRKCEEKLKKLRDLVERGRQRANLDAAEFSFELCRDIAELFDDRAEFTATARACSAELKADMLVSLARAVSDRTLRSAVEDANA